VNQMAKIVTTHAVNAKVIERA